MEGSRMPSLFREANREFEQEDDEQPGWAEPAPPASPGLGPSRARRAPPDAQMTMEIGAAGAAPAGRRTPEPEPRPGSPASAAQLVKRLELLMEEFGVDLTTVTQAFLKNSGEMIAVTNCLRIGNRLDGRPFWRKQDYEDLLRGREGARNNLETKYGVENVNNHQMFRKN